MFDLRYKSDDRNLRHNPNYPLAVAAPGTVPTPIVAGFLLKYANASGWRFSVAECADPGLENRLDNYDTGLL